MPEYITTYTGKLFNPLLPDENLIDIEDVAHSLSLVNRWTGHTRVPWSVAQHTLAGIAVISDPLVKLEFFLHDFAEAYIADVATPLKPFINNYNSIEKEIYRKVRLAHFLSGFIPSEVKHIDKSLSVIEYALFVNHDGIEKRFPDYQTYINGKLSLSIIELSKLSWLEAKELFKKEYFKCVQMFQKSVIK